MIEFIKQGNNKNLILFIHGFTGGKSTWLNPTSGYFFEQLLSYPSIAENFDVASFEYYSKLTNLSASLDLVLGKLTALFKHTLHISKKNISIEEIAELLRTEMRFKLKQYSNIVVIAHSMGGLVAKACILKDYEKSAFTPIKLFISLAVPHLGADAALYGQILSNNPQIKGLTPLGDICPKLNDGWVKLESKPEIKYFYGTHDTLVQKNSAVGTDNKEQDAIACDEDHLSISKPSGHSSTVIIAVESCLLEFIEKASLDTELEFKELESETQFDDEYFVLKLLLADVHNAIVRQSKEHFLNAEFARKLFSSTADQSKLNDLYCRIRVLYQDSFARFANGELANSGSLVNEVHSKIVDQDSAYLKSALPLIHALHKKGMLHQLANDLKRDIWWSENHSVSALDNLKSTLEK